MIKLFSTAEQKFTIFRLVVSIAKNVVKQMFCSKFFKLRNFFNSLFLLKGRTKIQQEVLKPGNQFLIDIFGAENNVFIILKIYQNKQKIEIMQGNVF